MNRETYCLLEKYMIGCMEDTAHDKEHVYRVLYNALDIAKTENNVNYDVLIAACLLHDIGRKEQFENPVLCHAVVGSEKAYQFLLAHDFEVSCAEQVRQCIRTHRYRAEDPPQSLEAKILFDADKLDAAGAMGIARTLLYKGIVAEPLYSLLPDGSVSTGEKDAMPSFFQEYKYKLENLYSHFYTERAAAIARERQHIAVAFYNSLYQEVNAAYRNGTRELNDLLEEKRVVEIRRLE
ncbi:MAG: HD domain-containing protein [Lachnospiraceae bacterium]|nr:HD domain-containing protein [Butyrivibrio sp.]MCM1344145.1 HD domain-containing protein [Muribaculaceae bacterium]MCM1411123.1 HD domain-containing protein [Lachnospiraceae bacterium]